ncbi:MAG: hypothetical protein ACKO2G_04865 [Verrucomicrobiales bacterium]
MSLLPIPRTRKGQLYLLLAVILMLGAVVAIVWNIGAETSGSKDKKNPTAGNASAGQATSPGGASRPWKTGSSGSGQAEDPGSEASPVVDRWMDEHWDEPDDKLITGLLEFTGRKDLGLAEKSQALDHALNLLPDPEYGKLGALLLDPGTPTALLQKVFIDLHNRNEKASLQASLLLIKREEAEIVSAAKALLAHRLDLDEENELEAIRLQAETRVIELEEEQPPPEDTVELDPNAPIPEGLTDATVPPPEE